MERVITRGGTIDGCMFFVAAIKGRMMIVSH